jgi:hypothetical protein
VKPVRHLDGLADDAGVAPESLAPEPIAQHEHRRRARLVFAVPEGATEQRANAERVEVVRGHHTGLHALRFATTQEVERHRVELDDRLERPTTRTEVGDLPHREPLIVDFGGRHWLLQPNDALAIGEGEVLEQNAVDDAEDCGVRSDPQGEREHGDDGVRRRAAEGACGVAKVL